MLPTTTTRWARRALSAAALSTLLLALGSATAPADAAVPLNAAGSVGWVHAEGNMACNPFPSSGVANRYIELGAPLVGEVAPSRTIYVGGNQQILWRPQLEKWVNGAWQAVWLSPWIAESSWSVPSTFANQFVDVYAIAGGGRGYYRMSATIWWLADANHSGGWMNYRLTEGNYFRDTRLGSYGMAPNAVSTPYCYIP